MTIPTLEDTYCRVDVLEKFLTREAMGCLSLEDPLKQGFSILQLLIHLGNIPRKFLMWKFKLLGRRVKALIW